jgi:CHAD domain-containing protein
LLNGPREFLLADDAVPDGDRFRLVSDSRYRLAARRSARTLRRTWLDTFDWRLFRAGLTLEHITGPGTAELVLTGRDGELVAAESAAGRRPTAAADAGDDAGPPLSALRWPCLAGSLPAGPLREQLAKVTGVRALLPVVRATSALSQRRALNADDKTVAVLTVDQMTLTQPRGAVAPARLSVSPLRGYQQQTARLADLIGRLPGVSVPGQSRFEAALQAAGRRPGDYTSKIDVRLSPDQPAALAVATVLTRLAATMQANVAGTIRDIDTEFLHDLRVAVRRTRSVLKLAGSVLPGSLVSRYRPEFKWLGDLTTPTRDLDVYLLAYDSMAAGLVAAGEAELHPFLDYLQRQRASAHRQLAKGLRSARFAGLTASWQQELEDAAASPGLRPATGKFAARRIARAHERVLRQGAAIGPASPAACLHELRKRSKELRYLLEVFASLYDPAEHWRAVNELKALQDCLGEFQDTEVQQAELRAFATRMVADQAAPAETLLAMGEIAAGLGRRQRSARAEFAGRFAGFSSPCGQARIAVLTRAVT